jgi:hypothetical protein
MQCDVCGDEKENSILAAIKTLFRGCETAEIEIAYFREFRQDMAATFSSAVS